ALTAQTDLLPVAHPGGDPHVHRLTTVNGQRDRRALHRGAERQVRRGGQIRALLRTEAEALPAATAPARLGPGAPAEEATEQVVQVRFTRPRSAGVGVTHPRAA